MTVQVIEHTGCFEIALTAESEGESLLLIRFGLNKTKDLRHISFVANADHARGFLVLGKKKQSRNSL